MGAQGSEKSTSDKASVGWSSTQKKNNGNSCREGNHSPPQKVPAFIAKSPKRRENLEEQKNQFNNESQKPYEDAKKIKPKADQVQ